MSIRPFPEKSSRYRSQEFIGAPITSLEQAYLVAYVDGGARGNPGPSGYGVVIEDELGRPVAQLSEFLGRQTNNYAEYSGLLAVLNYTLRHGFKALKVVSDSELMVKQINGQYKVSSPTLKELHSRAMKLIDQLDCFEIKHVLREKNREADRLANLAMDRGVAKKALAVSATDVGGVASVVPEINGVVRDGVVHFMGSSLPDGTMVKIRAVKA
jgi:ribonuclease HI